MPPPKNILNQTPSGIMQNNKVLIFVAVVLVGGFVLFLVWKSQNNQKAGVVENNAPKPTADMSASSTEIPEWMQKYKNMKPNVMGVFIKTQTPQEIEKQAITNQKIEFKKEISDDQESTELEIQKIKDKNKIDEEKLEYEAQESPLTIAVPSPPAAANAANQTAPTADISGAVESLKAAGDALKNGKAADPVKIIGDINNQDEKLSFLKNSQTESEYLKNGLESPRSPYEIKAGTFIPAALIVGIDTDMPGSVIGQVRANVYDTVTGNYILIPQGTKVVGSYDSKITYGQSRALVVWDRLIFPDGSSINLERMQGADITGMAGLKDKLNNHYFKLYSNALLLSFVGAGYDILNNQQNQNTQYSAQQAVAANVGQQLSNVASKSIEKNMDVQPTITLSPGYKFNIIVMKDMVLKEVKDAEGTLSYSN